MIEKFIFPEKWPTQALVLPRLQAHRGYCGNGAQENTLQAFRAARAKGALMFETDVRLSKDRVPVIFHDSDLKRLAGFPDLVSDLTVAQLREKVNAPTLIEALVDHQSPRFVNIELKSKEKLDDALERKVAEVVRKVRAESRVLFSSFNPMSLYRISLHLPEVPRALLVTEEDDPDNSVILRKMLLAPFIRIHMLNLDYKMLTEEKMNVWQGHKMPISVWTVNGQEQIQKYQKMGALSVISDSL
jgi:glycerophosphoryl diester phosphodiesterase